MSLVLQDDSSSPARSLIINGQEFKDGETLIKQIPIWKATLPNDKFELFLDEGAMFLSEWITTKKENLDEVAASYINASAVARENWGSYEKTPRFTQVWGELNKAAKNRDYNRSKRDRARKYVVDT